MAEEKISDDRFKSEMMRLMNTAILKIDENTKEIKGLKKEFQISSGKLDDAIAKVVEMHNRLFEIEKQLKSFNTRLFSLEEETKKIRLELTGLAGNSENNAEAKAKIDELNLRIERLEEKVFG